MELTLSQQRRRTAVSTMGDPKILGPAVGGAFRKLDPRVMVRNPVMFAVEIVASLTTVLFVRDLVTGAGGLGFSFQIKLWLWFTVLFANFAEAVAEGRGKAQAATPAQGQDRDHRQAAGRRRGHASGQTVPATAAQEGRRRAGRGGRSHPDRRRGDRGRRLGQRGGDHRRIGAGHPRERRRPLGGHRRHAGHLRLDQGARSPPSQGSTFLDRMIALVEGAERQKTPNEIALNILLAGMTIIFVFAVATHPELRRLCRRRDDACWCWSRCSSP